MERTKYLSDIPVAECPTTEFWVVVGKTPDGQKTAYIFNGEYPTEDGQFSYNVSAGGYLLYPDNTLRFESGFPRSMKQHSAALNWHKHMFPSLKIADEASQSPMICTMSDEDWAKIVSMAEPLVAPASA